MAKELKVKTTVYSVYVLIRDGKAIYVGCTSNIHQRIKKHRQDKKFNNYIVLSTYDDKKSALNAESSIIKFITLFGDSEWYNAEYILLAHKRDFYLRNNL